jgi:hypothetical protein
MYSGIGLPHSSLRGLEWVPLFEIAAAGVIVPHCSMWNSAVAGGGPYAGRAFVIEFI